jgi:hypothetical protein
MDAFESLDAGPLVGADDVGLRASGYEAGTRCDDVSITYDDLIRATSERTTKDLAGCPTCPGAKS